MNETRSYQEPDFSNHSISSQENGSAVSALGWGLFGRFIFANAGALFLLAGIICFFAYNWEDLPAFAKFGMIAAGMLIAAAFPLFRGLNTASGSLGLLACGILGGALMAVYGQVYQTGANAWELFRAWAVFLVPLAVLGRHAGLWFTLWLVSTLWGIFYLGQRADAFHDSAMTANITLYQCLAQTAFFVLWETAARFFSGPRFPFLGARWLPRVVGLSLLSFLTFVLALHIMEEGGKFGHPVIYTALYLALMGGGAFFYRVRRTDLFMLASGLFSLIVLMLTFIAHYLRRADSIIIFFTMVVILLTGSAVSGKFLMARYKKWKESVRQRRETAEEQAETAIAEAGEMMPENLALLSGFSIPVLRLALQGELHHTHQPEADDESGMKAHSPWQARFLMGLCAWIAVPCMIALIFVIFTSMFGTLGYAMLFLILLCSGIALTWLPGVFFEQAALCLCLTGAGAASVLLSIEIGNRELCFLPAIIIFAASAFPAKNNAYRFLAAALAVTLLFFQADLFFFPYDGGANSRFGIIQEAISFAFVFGLAAFGLIYAVCGVVLAHLWHKFTLTGKPVLQHHPFIAALFAVPLFLGGFSVLFHSSEILYFLAQVLGMSGMSIRMAGIGAAAGLGYLVFQLTSDLGIRAAPRIIMILLCIPVAAASWFMPWFGIGLLMLAMSRQAKSMALLGTATLFLAVCTILEYYALSTTLLIKSFSLGGIGIILLLAATSLHLYMTWRLRKGWLRMPSALAPVSNQKIRRRRSESDTAPSSPVRHTGRFARGILAGCILFFFLFFSYSVQQKERLLENGKRVILALRPVDPRSLMQGDFMILSLEIENTIYQKLLAEKPRENEPEQYLNGTVIAAPDENGVFQFVRFDDGRPLQDTEARLVYRGKRYGVRVGSGSFFFQEGYGKIFETARFVELRAGNNGETLMIYLLDENGQRIDPKQRLPAGD